MKLMKNSATYLVIFLVLLACCTEETEGMRRVLRGRRTLTRRYFTGLPIPGWALVLILGIAELILGAVLYFVMRRVILSKEVEQTNTYTPAPTTHYTPAPVPASPPSPTTTEPAAATTHPATATTGYTPATTHPTTGYTPAVTHEV